MAGGSASCVPLTHIGRTRLRPTTKKSSLGVTSNPPARASLGASTSPDRRRPQHLHLSTSNQGHAPISPRSARVAAGPFSPLQACLLSDPSHRSDSQSLILLTEATPPINRREVALVGIGAAAGAVAAAVPLPVAILLPPG
jgi:hypothetical protein